MGYNPPDPGPSGPTWTNTAHWVNSYPTYTCEVGVYIDDVLVTSFKIDNGLSTIFLSATPSAGTHTFKLKFMGSHTSGHTTRTLLQALELKR